MLRRPSGFEGLNIIAAVCARGGSKGVPRKNVRKVGGIPLLGRAIQCADEAATFDAIVVSTEDPEIAEVGEKYGALVPFLRPVELARDDSPKWPVFRHLVESWEATSGRDVDVLVDLDVAVPLRIAADIHGCLDLLATSSAEVVGTAYEAERNPYFNMVEVDGEGLATISKPVSPPIAARQHAPRVYGVSLSVIAIRREALWKYNHWSEARFMIFEIPKDRAIDVDTELDFKFAQFLVSGKSDAESLCSSP